MSEAGSNADTRLLRRIILGSNVPPGRLRPTLLEPAHNNRSMFDILCTTWVIGIMVEASVLWPPQVADVMRYTHDKRQNGFAALLLNTVQKQKTPCLFPRTSFHVGKLPTSDLRSSSPSNSPAYEIILRARKIRRTIWWWPKLMFRAILLIAWHAIIPVRSTVFVCHQAVLQSRGHSRSNHGFV